MRSALALHLADVENCPQPRGIDAYLEALRDSEGETIFSDSYSTGSSLN